MIEVACAIIIKNKKILVTQRSEKMSQPLKWEFPGGKVEEGESHEDCLRREIREELGLEIQLIQDLPSSVHQYTTDLIIKLIPFICCITGGSLTLKDHQEAVWLKKEQLNSLDWSRADLPVLEELLKNHLG